MHSSLPHSQRRLIVPVIVPKASFTPSIWSFTFRKRSSFRPARRVASQAVADEAEHLRKVLLVTDAALSLLPLGRLLDELLVRIRDALDADTAAFLLLDEETHELVARAAKGIEEEVERGVRIPLGRGFAGRGAAQAAPGGVEGAGTPPIFNPILREKGIKSLLGAPLVVSGKVTGVVHVGTLTHRDFTPDDVELLERWPSAPRSRSSTSASSRPSRRRASGCTSSSSSPTRRSRTSRWTRSSTSCCSGSATSSTPTRRPS